VTPVPVGTGTQQQQTYSFDDYGNLQSITTQIGAGTPVSRPTPTSLSTNRLTGAVSYDAAGNLTSWNGAVYQYDAFDQMARMTNGAEDWIYVYDADDERIWSYAPALNASRWTLRDLGGKVLRDFSSNNGTWSIAEDYIYRNGLLFAGYLGTGQRRHFALDHLGTVRLVTNTAGTQTGYHVYYPFGEEATAFDAGADPMQFTGHERDLNAQTGGNPSADDLDYMHARLFNPLVSRFTSTDSLAGSAERPQSWNLNAYVTGNPVNYTDPDGQSEIWVHQFSPAGMSPDEWGFGNEISVGTAPWNGTNANPLTGIAGLGGLIEGSLLLGYVSNSSIDVRIRSVRAFYEDRFEQMAVQGNYLAAAIDYLGLRWALPSSGRDLAFQGAMMFLPELKLGGKIMGQLTKRGWTKELIEEAIANGERIEAVNKATGNPATRFVHPGTGQSVVIDNVTGEVIHVGGPGFHYGPNSGDKP
jgi:RHS repeat-associated protein